VSIAFASGPVVAEYQVLARNTAAGGAGNPIHDDEEAHRHGYRGGLVPGVTTWAYLCHPLVEVLGTGFVEHGSADLRLVAPVYDGDEVRVEVRRAAEGALETVARAVEAVASVASGGVVARATAWGQEDVPGRPFAPQADARPVADETSLAPGRELGTVAAAVDEALGRAYLETIGESLPWFEDRHVVHPGQLLQLANRALAANVALGPWVHAGSLVRHRTLASWGDELEVRSRVHDRFERKGHHFVTLDVGIVRRPPGEGPEVVYEAVCEVRHTAIYRLAR
jgi:acyl dehydratase